MALEQIGLGGGKSDEVFDGYENVRSDVSCERSCRTNLSNLGVAMVEEFHQL